MLTSLKKPVKKGNKAGLGAKAKVHWHAWESETLQSNMSPLDVAIFFSKIPKFYTLNLWVCMLDYVRNLPDRFKHLLDFVTICLDSGKISSSGFFL